MNRRIEKIEFAELGAIALVGPANIAYFSGFRATPFERLILLVITPNGELRLVAPALEEEAARGAVDDTVRCLIWRDEEGPLDALRRALEGVHGPVGVEFGHLSLEQAALVRSAAGSSELRDCSATVRDARLRKLPEELALLQRACAILDDAITQVAREIEPGRSEADMAARCADAVRRHGGETRGFEPIVLTGPRSALPHGRPGATSLARGDLLIVDFGASFEGYFSDSTRTFVVGREPDERQRELLDIVHRAERAGIDAARPGVEARDVDRAARAVIEEAGFGEYFIHRTGHGLGLEVHEPPWLTATSEQVLDRDMIVTIEPGIYIPGYGGVRIEDDVRIDDPPEVLTHVPAFL